VADNILQSFVVQLKYSVDSASQKKFHDGIKQGITGLNGFRLALVGAAVGVEEMIRRTTGAYNTLAGLSSATSTSAASIEKLRAMFEGAHMSVGEADAALQKFAERMRLPQFHEFAEQRLGQPFTDLSDFIDKAAEHYAELKKKFSERDPRTLAWLGEMNAVSDGLGESVRRVGNELERSREFAKDNAEIYAALRTNADEATKKSADLDRVWHRVGKTLEVAVAKLLFQKNDKGRTLADEIEAVATAFAQWLIDPDTQKQLTAIINGIGDLVRGLRHAVDAVGGLGNAFEIMAIAFAIKWVAPLLGGIGSVSKALIGLRALAVSPVAGILGSIGATAFAAYTLWQQGTGKKGSWTDPNSKTRFMDPSMPFGMGTDAPKYQHGGIVPAGLHPGEMVLPQNISFGLQSFFAGGSGSLVGTMRTMLGMFVAWFAGDSSYKPQVDLSEETLERMGHGLGEEGAGAGGAPGGGRRRGGRFGGMGPQGGGDVSGLNLKTGPDEQVIRDTIRQAGEKAGLNPEQIRMAQAGFLSAFSFESNLRHDIVRPGGTDTGWAQWVGPRLRHMREYGDPRSIEANQKQLFYELTGPYREYLLRAGRARSPTEAATAAHYFESGGAPQFEGAVKMGHIRHAEAFYRKSAATEQAAATAPAQVAAAAAAAHDGIQAVVGDSIGVGIAKSLGMPGQDVKGGTTPRQIYDRVSKHIKEYANKVVAVTSGSNPPHQGYSEENIGYVRKLVHDLRGVGAKVLLAGVGAGVKDYTRINKALKDIADSEGIKFGGELAGTQRRGGVVHPDDYGKVVRQLNSRQEVTINVHGNDSPSTTAKTLEHTQSRVAANHLRNLRTQVA
jgi:hypothetical protein